MGVISGLIKVLGKSARSAKIIAESKNPIKVYKEVTKITNPLVDMYLPKAVISTAKEATGLRKVLMRNLVSRDVTKMIIPIPRPLNEAEKLAITIKKFQKAYPNGLIHKSSGMKKAMFGGTAVVATIGAFGIAKTSEN
jgi:hypothetical protein